MSDKKITYISLLQIAGPLFVVLGHSLNGLDIRGFWYIFTKEWIYIFHMPLFFLISGYLLAFKGYLGNRSYKTFILGKFKRLLIPYLFWNLLFCIPKSLVQNYIVDSSPSGFMDMLKLFIWPRDNIWGHTWFLFGLFAVYLAAPLFENVLKPKKPFVITIVLVGCVILYVLPVRTHFLTLSDLHKDLLFFVIGCLLGQMPVEKFNSLMGRFRALFITMAILSSALALIWYEQSRMLHFIPCGFVLMALLSVFASVKNLTPFLQRLSAESFGIYIMHWPVMIVVRIVLHQILNVGAGITSVVMIVSGYLVPILVTALIRKLPFEGIKKPLKYLLGV